MSQNGVPQIIITRMVAMVVIIMMMTLLLLTMDHGHAEHGVDHDDGHGGRGVKYWPVPDLVSTV